MNQGDVDGWRRSALLWAGALLLRLAYFAEMWDQPVFTALMVDSRAYDQWARSIAAGDLLGSGVFFQAPLYPYLLGGVYALFGPDPRVVFLLQALLGATACVFLERAGRRFFGPAVGLVGGVLLAVHPTAVFSDGLLQKSSLDIFLMTSFLLLLAKAGGPDPKPRLWAGMGAVLGIFTLTRENAVVLVPVALAWGAVEGFREGARGILKRAVPFLLCLVLVLLPVGIRNLAVGGEFHLTTSQAGPAFYIGNNTMADGMLGELIPGRGDVRFERLSATMLAERAAGRPLTPGEVSRHWMGEATTHRREADRLLN